MRLPYSFLVEADPADMDIAVLAIYSLDFRCYSLQENFFWHPARGR